MRTVAESDGIKAEAEQTDAGQHEAMHERTLALLQPGERALLEPLVEGYDLNEKLVTVASEVRQVEARKYWRLKRRLEVEEALRKPEARETRVTSIPRWIDRQAGLSELQKRFLARVEFLERKGQGCFQSNTGLAIEFGMTPGAIRMLIDRLKRTHWLRIENHPDGRRFLKLNRKKFGQTATSFSLKPLLTESVTARDNNRHGRKQKMSRLVTESVTARDKEDVAEVPQTPASKGACAQALPTESISESRRDSQSESRANADQDTDAPTSLAVDDDEEQVQLPDEQDQQQQQDQKQEQEQEDETVQDIKHAWQFAQYLWKQGQDREYFKSGMRLRETECFQELISREFEDRWCFRNMPGGKLKFAGLFFFKVLAQAWLGAGQGKRLKDKFTGWNPAVVTGYSESGKSFQKFYCGEKVGQGYVCLKTELEVSAEVREFVRVAAERFVVGVLRREFWSHADDKAIEKREKEERERREAEERRKREIDEERRQQAALEARIKNPDAYTLKEADRIIGRACKAWLDEQILMPSNNQLDFAVKVKGADLPTVVRESYAWYRRGEPIPSNLKERLKVEGKEL